MDEHATWQTKVREWIKRYLPNELAGWSGEIAAGAVVYWLTGSLAAAVVAGTVGSSVGSSVGFLVAVGSSVGSLVGPPVAVGSMVGSMVGATVMLGSSVGSLARFLKGRTADTEKEEV